MPKAVQYSANSVIYFSGDFDARVFLLHSGHIALNSLDIETGAQVTEYIKTGPKEIMEPYNYRLGFDIPKGKYEFDLIGLEKIEKTERESKNYGYAFVFKKNENAINNNLTKCDNEDDTYKFNAPKKNT